MKYTAHPQKKSITKLTTNVKHKTKDQIKIVDITIDNNVLNKQNIWHIIVKMSDKKPEEFVCPKDIFGYAIENYEAILNFFRVLHHSTKPIRHQMRMLSTPPRIKQSDQINPQNQKTSHDRNTEKQMMNQRTRTVNFLSNASDTLKKNLTTGTGILEQSALALALTNITFKEIDRKIKTDKKFYVSIPISKYPDLSSMQNQHSVSWLSMIESMTSIGASVAPYFAKLPI